MTSIYLAGHVDRVDDYTTWRDNIKNRYPYDFIDPTDKRDEYLNNPGPVVAWCLEQARNNDMLVGFMDCDKPTTGTHYEIAECIRAGNTVAIHKDGDLSPFFTERGVFYIDENIDNCVGHIVTGDEYGNM